MTILPKTGIGWTRTIIVATVIVLSLYDLLAVLLWGQPATISRQIYFCSQDYPIIPFCAGILCGHLWVPQHIYVDPDTGQADKTK